MTEVADIISMHTRIRGFIKSPALEHYPVLDAAVGHSIKIFIKPEVLQTTGSFKVRNAFAALSSLPDAEKQRGVIAASTGNLGQALALAGNILGVPVTICVKQNNNPKKNNAIKAFGAELIEQGDNYDEAYDNAIKIAAQRGIPYIRSSENMHAFCGAATVGLEIFEEQKKIDRVVVAVGSGAHAAGCGLLARSLSPHTKVTGMQAATSCTVHDHWHRKARITPETGTIADAISMGSTHFASSVALLQDTLHEFNIADDDEICDAIRLAYKTTGHIVEPAGAIGLAGILANRDRWQGETIAVVFSGGNLNDNLRYLLD